MIDSRISRYVVYRCWYFCDLFNLKKWVKFDICKVGLFRSFVRSVVLHFISNYESVKMIFQGYLSGTDWCRNVRGRNILVCICCKILDDSPGY